MKGHQPNEHKREIEEATRYLHNEVIPKFAQALDQAEPTKQYPLLFMLHSYVSFSFEQQSNSEIKSTFRVSM